MSIFVLHHFTWVDTFFFPKELRDDHSGDGDETNLCTTLSVPKFMQAP